MLTKLRERKLGHGLTIGKNEKKNFFEKKRTLRTCNLIAKPIPESGMYSVRAANYEAVASRIVKVTFDVQRFVPRPTEAYKGGALGPRERKKENRIALPPLNWHKSGHCKSLEMAGKATVPVAGCEGMTM